MFALRSQPTVTPTKSFVDRNLFEDLGEDEEELSDDVIHEFSQWAHKVKVDSKSPKASTAPIGASCLKDLDKQIAENPRCLPLLT